MTKFVSVLAGDGIGPEVMEPALKELPSDYVVKRIPANAERYLATGDLLTPGDMKEISNSDALLFGAIGDPRVPDGVLERGILLELRKQLDLYVNLRPFPGLDLVFVRENTEGSYAGMGKRTEDTAVEISVNTRTAIERCARYAFDLALQRRGRVTLVHKRNVMTYAGGLWTEVIDEVAKRYTDVDLAYEHADAAAYHLVTDHSRFDVIVTDNLFGDVLSDLAAGLDGGLGRAASANLHADMATRPTRCVGLFEPVHGSAPDIVGTGTADPTAAIEAARMLVSTLEKEPVLA
ncbi:MAG TPA: isocitrate/isopropylmalate family dehydrogenase [Actinomycetota bacterium]|nr:isocitrate/isopropylmalate family dehydrogenase [Actinomycetota bacterium]